MYLLILFLFLSFNLLAGDIHHQRVTFTHDGTFSDTPKTKRVKARACKSDEASLISKGAQPPVILRSHKTNKKPSERRRGRRLFGFIDSKKEHFVSAVPQNEKEPRKFSLRVNVRRSKSDSEVANRRSLREQKTAGFKDKEKIYQNLNSLVNHGDINMLYEKRLNEIYQTLRDIKCFLPEELHLLTLLWHDHVVQKWEPLKDRANFQEELGIWWELLRAQTCNEAEAQEGHYLSGGDDDNARETPFFDAEMEATEWYDQELADRYASQCFLIAGLSSEERNYLTFLAENFLLLFREVPLDGRILFKKLYDCLTITGKENITSYKAKEHLLSFIFLRLLQPMILDLRIESHVFSEKEMRRFHKELRTLNKEERGLYSLSALMRSEAVAKLRESGTYYESLLLKVLMKTFTIWQGEVLQTPFNKALEILKNDLAEALLQDD